MWIHPKALTLFQIHDRVSTFDVNDPLSLLHASWKYFYMYMRMRVLSVGAYC